MAAARADIRTAAKPTADQMRVLKILEQLAGAADWRGVAAQERAARAVAAAVRTWMPSKARRSTASSETRMYQSLGSFSQALEHHKEHLAISKEVGDRAGEGMAYGNLGNAYRSQGDFSQAIHHVPRAGPVDLKGGGRPGGGGQGVREQGLPGDRLPGRSGGVTRQGVALTDLQSMIVNKLLSLAHPLFLPLSLPLYGARRGFHLFHPHFPITLPP
jgi:tetratricopeptide (TPR) repeat protein